MKSHTAYSICAGLLAGLLYIISITGIVVGVFVMALPLLPLLWTAFRFGGQAITVACTAASLFVLGLSGFNATLMFIMLISLPSWVYGTKLMHVRVTQNLEFIWYPIGLSLCYLSAYFAGACIALEWLLSLSDESLFTIIKNDITKAAQTLDPNMANMLTSITNTMPYILIATFAWLWAFMLYAASILAHFECFTRGKTPRSHMAMQPFIPPLWLPALTGACFLVGQSTHENISFIAMASFFILLLPYFFCGMANIQQLIARQTNPRMWRISFFLILIIGGWPILLIVTAIGIYHHISSVLQAQTT